MGVFRRRRRPADPDVEQPGVDGAAGDGPEVEDAERPGESVTHPPRQSAPQPPGGSAAGLPGESAPQPDPEPPAAPAVPEGPWDVAQAPQDELPRLDLGSLQVPVPPQTEVRVEVSEQGAVLAATLVRDGSAVQVNAFAAPRTQGIWAEVRAELAEQVTGSGGSVQERDGAYGVELAAVVPTQVEGQGIVLAPARYVGVDGPRWFLRALYTGPAAVDAVAAQELEQAVRGVVVSRGTEPMAVREQLPLALPQDVVEAAAADTDAPDGLELAERGPEITETR